jgi:uncharacterized membrane protein YkoI
MKVSPAMFRSLTLAVVGLTALSAVSAAARADGTRCFATWSEADTVARREALVAVEQVSTLARSSLSGAEVVKSTLCEEGGRYVYRLVVREAKGQLKTINVDARHPFAK